MDDDPTVDEYGYDRTTPISCPWLALGITAQEWLARGPASGYRP